MDLESLEGFDVDDALHRLRGNRGLYTKLLHDLAARHGGDAERIREATLAENLEVARQVAHQLKGVAGNLSASGLHAAAAELVLALDACGAGGAGERARAAELLARLEERLARAVRAIGSLSQGAATRTAPAGGAVPLDAPLRVELAGALRQAVELGDVEAVESAVARLPEGSQQRSELQELVDVFDFAGVERLAAELERGA